MLDPFAVLVVPSHARLSTAAGVRGGGPPREYAPGPRSARPAREFGVNDLQDAAISLEPSIAPTLAAVLEAGAEYALVCGSGPTVIGLSPCARRRARADAAPEGGRETVAAVPYGD